MARLLLEGGSMKMRDPGFWLSFALMGLGACSGGDGPGREPTRRPPKTPPSIPAPTPKPAPPPVPAGTPVDVTLGAVQQAEVDRLASLLDETRALSPEELLRRRAVPFQNTLGYDPRAAVNLDLIQASALGLDAAELAALARHGFVISDKRRYPHFAYGYKTIYSQDLPVFISADSILQAVHQSYEGILKAVEIEALIPELDALLTSMRGRLHDSTLARATSRDVDLYLTVAHSLLRGKLAPPTLLADTDQVSELFNLATLAEGDSDIDLFGVADRIIDASQFKPRGHYAGDPRLEQYFRAMMWLGRIDLPFLHTDPQTGRPKLIRLAIDAALALRSLLDEDGMARWKRIDATVRAFVGEPDSMAPPEVDRLRADLGLDSYDLGAVSDAKLAAAIVAGAYGRQKILSQIVIQAPHRGAWPLDATFLFFGQRYVFDSHVFSNLVYDRVNGDGPPRMMPNPLDAAFAALGNDQAAELLRPELVKHRYAPALESMRRLGEEHGAAFWDANLYNLWLGALRALSPGPDLARADSGLPPVARTEAWGRRLLNTQLASWAQLRHDTILYAKQSYTSGIACEFPDAYVEPNPAFFSKIGQLAEAGRAVVVGLPLHPGSGLGPRILAYFAKLGEVSGTLRDMAQHQLSGMPHRPRAHRLRQPGRLARGRSLRRPPRPAWLVRGSLLRSGDGRNVRSDHCRRAHPADRRGRELRRPRAARRDRLRTPDGHDGAHLHGPPSLRRPGVLVPRAHHREPRAPQRRRLGPTFQQHRDPRRRSLDDRSDRQVGKNAPSSAAGRPGDGSVSSMAAQAAASSATSRAVAHFEGDRVSWDCGC